MGHLQESYRLFQLELSTRLAGEHPEISQELCLDLLTRHLASTDRSSSVLPCLRPWLENVTLSKNWECTWTEAFLSRLVLTTLSLDQSSSAGAQPLWATLAAKDVNLEAIIDFVLVRCMHECNGGATDRAVRFPHSRPSSVSCRGNRRHARPRVPSTRLHIPPLSVLPARPAHA